MNRIAGMLTALAIGLLFLVPTAAAADPLYRDGRVVLSVRGDITLPAGQHADSLIVVEGTATVEGDVGTIFVLNGTVNLVGSATTEIVAFASHVSLDATSVVSGDIRIMTTTVSQAAGSTVGGSVREGLDVGKAMLFIGPALFVAYLGFVITALVIAVALAALAARQVRATQTLMRERSGAVIVAGLVGLIGLPLAAALVMVTIVGIPLGLTMLLGVLPFLYVGGYLVVAIWIGEWLLAQAGRPAESRPIAAAIVGTLVVGVISLVPFVGGLVGFFGFGAVLLQLWQTLRHATAAPVVAADAMAPAVA